MITLSDFGVEIGLGMRVGAKEKSPEWARTAVMMRMRKTHMFLGCKEEVGFLSPGLGKEAGKMISTHPLLLGVHWNLTGIMLEEETRSYLDWVVPRCLNPRSLWFKKTLLIDNNGAGEMGETETGIKVVVEVEIPTSMNEIRAMVGASGREGAVAVGGVEEGVVEEMTTSAIEILSFYYSLLMYRLQNYRI